ncbi:CASP-like protein 2A1 [Vigna radiata var. radiata]|uniref:CASP-like protein n=1 Tax=Vigna radiata var. radiata TaxID=3916 RepID=A0A1S3UDA5_VIGRR|nr:CASP-like protein 2A1 [Vigna radiata var. radiata]
MEEGSGVLQNSRSDKRLIGGEGTHDEFEGNSSFIRVVETLLRLFPIALSVTALIIMLKNSEENEYGSVSYTDLSAFRYLVHANGICAGYSLLSVVFIALPRLSSSMPINWTFFLLDQVLTYLILGAGAASMEVLYLAEKGNATTGWSSACSAFGLFCHKLTASIAITFVAVICYVFLSLISSYKLFSKYDAPDTSNISKGVHISAFHG